MGKLSLSNLNFEATDLLQREQLKTVFGGYVPVDYPCYDTGCMVYCHDQGMWLYENSSMTDQQIINWVNACMGSCCNG